MPVGGGRLNTTIEDSGANTKTARRFVAATRGDVATITYLRGPFPRGSNAATGLTDAANPRYALDMAPRLVAFSEDIDRTVDATGRDIPVTYIGHSYGGSLMGTAEAVGLTGDPPLDLEAAGAGVGVDDPSDWHNRNLDVRPAWRGPRRDAGRDPLGDRSLRRRTIRGGPGGPQRRHQRTLRRVAQYPRRHHRRPHPDTPSRLSRTSPR